MLSSSFPPLLRLPSFSSACARSLESCGGDGSRLSLNLCLCRISRLSWRMSRSEMWVGGQRGSRRETDGKGITRRDHAGLQTICYIIVKAIFLKLLFFLKTMQWLTIASHRKSIWKRVNRVWQPGRNLISGGGMVVMKLEKEKSLMILSDFLTRCQINSGNSESIKM